MGYTVNPSDFAGNYMAQWCQELHNIVKDAVVDVRLTYTHVRLCHTLRRGVGWHYQTVRRQ